MQYMSIIANALEKEEVRDRLNDECAQVTVYLNEHSDIPLHNGPCLDRLQTLYNALDDLNNPLSIDQYRRWGNWPDIR